MAGRWSGRSGILLHKIGNRVKKRRLDDSPYLQGPGAPCTLVMCRRWAGGQEVWGTRGQAAEGWLLLVDDFLSVDILKFDCLIHIFTFISHFFDTLKKPWWENQGLH